MAFNDKKPFGPGMSGWRVASSVSKVTGKCYWLAKRAGYSSWLGTGRNLHFWGHTGLCSIYFWTLLKPKHWWSSQNSCFFEIHPNHPQLCSTKLMCVFWTNPVNNTTRISYQDLTIYCNSSLILRLNVFISFFQSNLISIGIHCKTWFLDIVYLLDHLYKCFFFFMIDLIYFQFIVI